MVGLRGVNPVWLYFLNLLPLSEAGATGLVWPIIRLFNRNPKSFT